MSEVNGEELAAIEIDLSFAKNQELNEDYLGQFGAAVGMLLKAITQGYTVPVKVRGTETDIKKFANVLSGERKYMTSYNKYGLNHEDTYSSKYKLDKAVKEFERSTGLKWPFK
mgnify:CR=1 FL=1|tara:strand:- start:218 stop:556 length:339 start_codon:yes stop_codon:yes gene_type:complete